MADKIKTLATVIANDLFTAGPGDKPDQSEHAERLLLWLDSKDRDIGGWCDGALRERIEMFLRDAGVIVPQSHPPHRPRTMTMKTAEWRSSNPRSSHCWRRRTRRLNGWNAATRNSQ